MRTISEIFNLNPNTSTSPPSTQLISRTKIGIEIEIENLRDGAQIPGWNLTRDGSLRNSGYEYVFAGPTGGKTAVTRLKALTDSLNNLDTKVDTNERGSVHVHVDVRDLTWDQMIQMFLLYAIVEPYLFDMCGENRDDNIYSLALYKGEDQIEQFQKIIAKGPAQLVSNKGWSKYSAINLLSLTTFGSLEFRGHKATINMNEILNWTNHLLYLKEFTLDPRTSVNDLPQLISSHGPIELLRKIFHDLAPSTISRITEKKLFKSVWICEDLLYTKQLVKAQKDIFVTNNITKRD